MLYAMELHAVTGQLFIQEGAPQDDTAVPGLLAQSAPARVAHGRERDFLFVHLTLTGPLDETAELTQTLLTHVSQQYYSATGSVTAALRRALGAANEKLLHHNLSGADPAREGAITCAVLRSSELFMVQAGESLALLGHNFGIERLPARRPERVTPLGRSAGLDLRYFHHRLQPGDMLLLADPRIAHLPAAALTPALVDTEVELGLVELKGLLADDSARLLLVEFTNDPPYNLPPVARASVSGGRIALPRAQAAAPAAPPPRQPVRAQTPPPAAPDPAELAAAVETTARRAASGSALGLARLTGWLADVLGRLRPPRAEAGAPAAEEEAAAARPHWTIPALIAIVIPIVVTLVVFSVYLRWGRVQRVAEIKQEMAYYLSQADALGDDTTAARAQYVQLMALAAEAETLRPGDEGINRMRRQAAAELDRIDGVTRLTARPLYVYDTAANLTAVALRDGFNGGIFTLDAQAGEVWLHETDEAYTQLTGATPEPLVANGQAIGSHVVGEIVDILWRPRGRQASRDGLAMLDRRGALLTYYPNFADIRAVQLGFGSGWRRPVAITTFVERLYVLDAGANLIWKYFPDQDNFILDEDDQTIRFTADPELGQAVDIDIYSEDGSLIVAYGDGRLRYYDTRSSRVQWDEQSLLQNGLSTPLEGPTAVKLVGRGLNASIFVCDAGSGRLIQISRGGVVLAQYRATDANGQELFARAADFAVAETPLRIFVAAGDTLYLVTQQ